MKATSLFKSALLAASMFGALPAFAQQSPAPDPALISRGEYLARAGDCVACHTAPGGKPFAGGLVLDSDVGRIVSTNITPDRQHGIGAYTEAQFSAALREGVRADGAHLYPAMPYTSYSKVTDEDVHALYAYFMKGVTPVASSPPETSLGFPFSQRWGMALWNFAFADTKRFTPDPNASAEVNRGAYLVEGLGHCGSCHTPRGLAMEEKSTNALSASFLTGSELNGWTVPSLRGPTSASKGFASWTAAEIVDYLGTGRNAHAAVGGEMTSAVQHSLAHLNDPDLHAIAAYLKAIAGNAQPASAPADNVAATTAKLTAAKNLSSGERLYLDNCNACHFVGGQGAARVFPALNGASLVNASNPTGLITTILGGAATPSTARSPSVLPMPGYAYRLNDQEVADLATFVRSAWTNDASAVTAAQVAPIRAKLDKH